MTGSGRKGIKTIIKVGTDGRSYYLITKKGVRLVKNVEEAKTEPKESDRMYKLNPKKRYMGIRTLQLILFVPCYCTGK